MAMLYDSSIVQIEVKKTSRAIIQLIECFIIKSYIFLSIYSLIYILVFTQMLQIGQRQPQNKHYEKYNVSLLSAGCFASMIKQYLKM